MIGVSILAFGYILFPLFTLYYLYSFVIVEPQAQYVLIAWSLGPGMLVILSNILYSISINTTPCQK